MEPLNLLGAVGGLFLGDAALQPRVVFLAPHLLLEALIALGQHLVVGYEGRDKVLGDGGVPRVCRRVLQLRLAHNLRRGANAERVVHNSGQGCYAVRQAPIVGLERGIGPPRDAGELLVKPHHHLGAR